MHPGTNQIHNPAVHPQSYFMGGINRYISVRGNAKAAKLMIVGTFGLSTLDSAEVTYGRSVGILPFDVTLYRIVSALSCAAGSSLAFPTTGTFTAFRTLAAVGKIPDFCISCRTLMMFHSRSQKVGIYVSV